MNLDPSESIGWLHRTTHCDTYRIHSLKSSKRRITVGLLAMRILLVTGIIAAVPCALAADAPRATSVTLGGIIHPDSDDTLAFTPDGKTVFFDRSEGPHKTIMISHQVAGRWSPARVASFSGQWFDQDPLVSPDGSYILFDSDRPTKSGGEPLTQDYFVGGKAPGSNIWRVDRVKDGWGKPVWLGSTINNDVFVDFPSLAADGTLYYIRWNNAEKAMHIWRSLQRGGKYLAPELVTIGDAAVSVHDPAVAPDQSFIVFDYGKVKGGLRAIVHRFPGRRSLEQAHRLRRLPQQRPSLGSTSQP